MCFFPRNASSFAVLAVARRLPVGVSLCHKSMFCRNGWKYLTLGKIHAKMSTMPKTCEYVVKTKAKDNLTSCYVAQSTVGVNLVTKAKRTRQQPRPRRGWCQFMYTINRSVNKRERCMRAAAHRLYFYTVSQNSKDCADFICAITVFVHSTPVPISAILSSM